MKAAFGYRVIVSLRRILARMLESLPRTRVVSWRGQYSCSFPKAISEHLPRALDRFSIKCTRNVCSVVFSYNSSAAQVELAVRAWFN